MIRKSASKWLSLATITILGQPPRDSMVFIIACYAGEGVIRQYEQGGEEN